MKKMLDLLTIPGFDMSDELEAMRQEIAERMRHTAEHPVWSCKPIMSEEEYIEALNKQGYSIRRDGIPQYMCIVKPSSTTNNKDDNENND